MSEVDDLIKQKEDALYYKDLRDCALRLYQNPDWKKLILDEFLLKECARYAQQSAHPNLDAVGRADALLIAQSAGAFKRFLSAVIQKGNHGEGQLHAIEMAIVDAENPEREEE